MCKPPKPFLMVTIQNGAIKDSVTRAELTHNISAGIRWGALGADMVPTFEETSARLERGYSVEAWSKMDAMEKAIVIAQRRIDIAVKNLQAEAEMRDAKRRQRTK